MTKKYERCYFEGGSELPARTEAQKSMHVTRECHMGIAEESILRLRGAAEALIEQNLSAFAAAAWEMHERRGRGMLVLRLEDVLKERDKSGDSGIEEVGLPYLTEGEYEVEKPKAVLGQLRTYDPTAEIILAVAWPHGPLSLFTVETSPPPPVAAAFKYRQN